MKEQLHLERKKNKIAIEGQNVLAEKHGKLIRKNLLEQADKLNEIAQYNEKIAVLESYIKDLTESHLKENVDSADRDRVQTKINKLTKERNELQTTINKTSPKIQFLANKLEEIEKTSYDEYQKAETYAEQEIEKQKSRVAELGKVVRQLQNERLAHDKKNTSDSPKDEKYKKVLKNM